MYYVYMLRCSDNSLYTGITNDLERRLLSHNLGKASKYTRPRLPVKMVYFERQESKSDALKREMELKKLSKSQKEALIENNEKPRFE